MTLPVTNLDTIDFEKLVRRRARLDPALRAASGRTTMRMIRA